jgi:hypothetical protein
VAVLLNGCVSASRSDPGPKGVTRTFLNSQWLGASPADVVKLSVRALEREGLPDRRRRHRRQRRPDALSAMRRRVYYSSPP